MIESTYLWLGLIYWIRENKFWTWEITFVLGPN